MQMCSYTKTERGVSYEEKKAVPYGSVIISLFFLLAFNGVWGKCDICGKSGASYELFGYHLCRDCHIDVTGHDADEDSVREQIEIVDQDLSVRDSGNYFDYKVTVKNNSDETLSYIQVDIYLKDASENIIHSDWTNWSGSLPPGASTTLDTMIDYVENVEYYSTVVADIDID